MFNSRINNKFGNYKPNKNWFKTIDVDRKQLYSVVILTNSPDMVDYSNCDRVYELLVDKGDILNKLKKNGAPYSYLDYTFKKTFEKEDNKVESLLKDIKENMVIEECVSFNNRQTKVKIHDEYFIEYLRKEINKLIK